MSDILISVDKAGRLVLPKQVRDELDIAPGDLLQLSVHGNEVTLQPRKSKPGFVRRGLALVFSSSGGNKISGEQVSAILDELREERTGVGMIARKHK